MFPVIPDAVKLHRRGSCVPTVIACLPYMKDGRDFVIEGWVRFGNRGWKHEHTWMIIGGKVFDPSLVQFEQLQAFPNPLHRLQERGIPVREYRRAWRDALSPWWIDRCRSFGVSPWSTS